jgi:hypothetical protein
VAIEEDLELGYITRPNFPHYEFILHALFFSYHIEGK